jgi:hypothetical protein
VEEKMSFRTSWYRRVQAATFAKGRYIRHGGTAICISNLKLRQSVTISFDISDIFKLKHPSSFEYMSFFLLLELMVQSPLAKVKMRAIGCYTKQLQYIL